ncbi:MAG TPA: hypothetical protein VF729_01160, partial [Solirubrobacterales bacterium]
MRRAILFLLTAVLGSALAATPAQGAFGLNGLEVEFLTEAGDLERQAGNHPFEMGTAFNLNTIEERGGGQYIDGAIRDLDIEQALGFAGNPSAVPRCTTLEFLDRSGGVNNCADSSAIGFTSGQIASYGNIASFDPVPVYLLEPAPGTAGKIAFWVQDVPIAVDLGLTQAPPYRVFAKLQNIPGVVEVVSAQLTAWGNPADPDHDTERGRCRETFALDSCPANIAEKPLITLPRRCSGPLQTLFRAIPWWTGDPLA